MNQNNVDITNLPLTFLVSLKDFFQEETFKIIKIMNLKTKLILNLDDHGFLLNYEKQYKLNNLLISKCL